MSKKSNTSKRDWAAYNKALIQRGSLTVWIDEEALADWMAQAKPGKRGRPFVFSDIAILFCLTLREVYHLGLRATQGFAESIFQLMDVELPVPDYSTFSRRSAKLPVDLGATVGTESRVILLDSTGLKVFGEGEWKTRQHGYSKRRTWRKLHLAVDAKTQQIVACRTTTNRESDASQAGKLLDEVESPVEEVKADGAYDQRRVYETIEGHQARPVIPPRRNAKIHKHGNRAGPREARDENLREIRRYGRKKWKQKSGYHERSLVETAMFRLKQLTGGRLRHRKLTTQQTEARIKCRVLNRMPRSEMLESES